MQPVKLFSLLLAFISYEISAQPYHTLVAPTTSLYTITLNFYDHYVIDLTAPFSWYKCAQPHRPVACTAPVCAQAQSYRSPLCPLTNTTAPKHCTCTVTPVNPVTKSCAVSQLTDNNFTVSWTNGRTPTVPNNFNHLYLSCVPVSLLQSLRKGVFGLTGLSWSPLSLSSQLTPPSLRITNKFAICLPSLASATGVVFFGDGPYYLPPPTDLDANTIIAYTPLLQKPKSPEFYIGLNSLSINGNPIPISTKSAKLSTVTPYTTLRSDVYKSFLKSFSKGTKSIPREKTIKPFDLCLIASEIGFTRLGFRVPQIDLELGNGRNWTIFGRNPILCKLV